MYLNHLRDQVADFLNKLKEDKFTENEIIKHLEEELASLKNSLNDDKKYRHQIYDLLYLLLELAAKHHFDLDLEWQQGQVKKQKYIRKTS